ncbi:hypothetical protein FISHEDRAFT_8737, partial [Fistulina hepatica ATCC 64428]
STYWSQSYHNSALSGYAWVQELIHGHPDRICTELGMSMPVFLNFVIELCATASLKDSRYVTLKEKAMIFLY